MYPSSSMKRFTFRGQWPTMQTALLLLWTVFGLAGSTEFKSSKDICFSTAWNETLSGSSGVNETLSLVEIYHYQVEQATEEQDSIVMLPSCLEDGQFSLSSNIVSTPVGERPYSREFQIRVRLNASLSEINQEFSLLEAPSVTVWFRVLACNVQEIGFCHPFVDMHSWNDQYIPVATDLSETYTIRSNQETNGVISSQWIDLPLLYPSRGDSSLRVETSSNLSMIMPDITGKYDFVGHAIVHLLSNDRYYRTDVGTSFVDNPVVAETETSEADGPEILVVQEAAKVAIGVMIGLGCTFILLCLGIVVYYRNHRVMTLAQAGLLAWLTGSCFFAVLLSFLVLPTRDSFCRYSSLAIIPASMSVNIMIGRLFRVYSTLGTAHRLGKSAMSSSAKPGRASTRMYRQTRKAEDMMMAALGCLAFSRCFGTAKKRTRSSSLRQATTQRDSIRLILCLSTPEIILSVTRTCLYDGGLIFEYDEANMTSRQVCDNDGMKWYRYTGLTLILLQYILCLFVAWCSRDLPAAFNETAQIFKAAMWGVIVSLTIVLLQIFFDLPSTAPGISSVVHVVAMLSLVLPMIFYIVMPKIRRVLSGKKIVVSNLLRELPGTHHTAEKDFEDRNAGTGTHNHMDVSKLVMKKDSPLPMEVETDMYELSEVIGSLRDKCISAHAITAEDLRILKDAASSLTTKIERVQFDDQSADDNADVVPGVQFQQSDHVAIPDG